MALHVMELEMLVYREVHMLILYAQNDPLSARPRSEDVGSQLDIFTWIHSHVISIQKLVY